MRISIPPASEKSRGILEDPTNGDDDKKRDLYLPEGRMPGLIHTATRENESMKKKKETPWREMLIPEADRVDERGGLNKGRGRIGTKTFLARGGTKADHDRPKKKEKRPKAYKKKLCGRREEGARPPAIACRLFSDEARRGGA